MSETPRTGAQALRQAIGATALADPEIASLLAGPNIHDAVPDRVRPPYVVIGRTSAADWSTATEEGEAVTLFLHVWTTAEHRNDNEAIQRALRRVAGSALVLDAHQLVALRHELSETRRDPATGHVHGLMRLRAIIEPQTN